MIHFKQSHSPRLANNERRGSGETWRDTYPPITVLLTQDHQDLALGEAQLIVMVGLAVVERFNSTSRRTSRLQDIPGEMTMKIILCVKHKISYYKYFSNRYILLFAGLMDTTSAQLDGNYFCATPKISPMICGGVAVGRGLVCHSQSSVIADWWASCLPGLYWMGT